MNKSELKSFAIATRRDLLEKVALRAKLFGITEENDMKIEEKFGQLVINNKQYPLHMKSTFLTLNKELKIKGYEQLIEEVAYTWFNRIIAIRYMEVNEYLPERVNVLSSSSGKMEPDILLQYETMELEINKADIHDLIRQGNNEQAYRKLFIAQCNALNKPLPFLFERINDYTELLLPDFLLDSESVISRLIQNKLLLESFKEVEVIGWLYQFYNSEPKDEVFTNLKKNKKIEKQEIPAATQLFTPKWIVQYMVENSLGQLWVEANPDSYLKRMMRYYIEPAEQDQEGKERLELIRYKNVNLEEIKIIDPCCGSGHILVYAFDLLCQMYEEAGYPISDIPQLILENNLYGLDIDDRATQLTSFALMMKGRERSRRILRKQINLNIYAIQESNHLDKEGIGKLLGQSEAEKKELDSVIETFMDAKNFGSILQSPPIDYDKYLNRIKEFGEVQLTVETFKAYDQLEEVMYFLQQAKILHNQYDIVVTNPPYMGSKGMNSRLVKHLRDSFPNTKSDLSTVYMEKSLTLARENGFIAMINIPSWMFLSTYENFRSELINNHSIYNLVHLGRGIFGADFGTVTFVLRNCKINSFKGIYKRLIDRQGEVDSLERKENKFFEENRDFYINQQEFSVFPSSSIIYWVNEKVRTIFRENHNLYRYTVSASQNVTGNNKRFLRYFWEIDKNNYMDVEGGKWRFYAKGGGFRKWYGNLQELVDWSPESREIYRTGHASQIIPEAYWYRKGITWGLITSSKPSFRVLPKEATYDKGGSSIFVENDRDYEYILALLNSKIGLYFLGMLAPTLNFQVRDVRNLPLVKPDNLQLNKIKELTEQCINIVEADWNFSETSWGFKCHPFLTHRGGSSLISNAFKNWKTYTEKQFTQLKTNEEELNRIFIRLYGLQEELTPEIPDAEITIRKAERIGDTKSFLSYFIGCVMGRYSLDVEGLTYAGGDWDNLKYNKFKPNKYGVTLLTDEHYFDHDIVARLREFLSITFDTETVEENLQWLAESLELRRHETTEERLRRYFLDEFYKNHVQTYQKRPIYWLINSGRQKGLRTLLYIHRYQPDTIATIRFEHLQEIQAKYNNEVSTIDMRLVNPNLSATEKRDLQKKKTTYQKYLEELLEFDKELATYANTQIVINLDDGVKVNYEKFNKILAKL